MNKGHNTRILLIDDDQSLGQLLQEYLEVEGFHLEMAPNGVTGLQKADKNYELILLDVMMPDMSGFDVLKQLRQRQNRTPILMLTAKGDEMDRVLGLELGADDYLAKPYSHRELVARIRALIRRANMDNDESPKHITLEINEVVLDTATHTVKVQGQLLELTTTEFRVLQALMQEAGTVIDKNSLNIAALGRPIELYDRSIDMHVSNLRKKMSAIITDDQKIKTIRGVGYMFITGEDE
ncbi:response regulator transcription factor [Gynuella sp.]|uniref:response regulator transcription factor n=1 Tax=Gynuella sp. TaxID=2969146 RepID=UPI003D1507A6